MTDVTSPICRVPGAEERPTLDSGSGDVAHGGAERMVSSADRPPMAARQAVLDAAAILQVRRTEAAARASRSATAGLKVVARGAAINPWMRGASESWREVLSVRPGATAAEMRYSVPHNRVLLARGLKMVSVFDLNGTDLEARILLANEAVGTYLLSLAPVQMKIVDRSYVLLEGPSIDGEASVMEVRTPECLDAAWRYWHATRAIAAPVDRSVASLDGLTPRQRQVVGLMATGVGDDAIADALDVSVRTVRADIASVLELLGVKTRFAAGVRLQLWPDKPTD